MNWPQELGNLNSPGDLNVPGDRQWNPAFAPVARVAHCPGCGAPLASIICPRCTRCTQTPRESFGMPNNASWQSQPTSLNAR